MKIYNFKSISVLLLICMLLTACGGGESASETGGSTMTETTGTSVTEPVSTQPPTTETAPTDPAPTEPAPTEPAPTEPAPTEPAPTDPAPTEPEPTDPAPTEPVPPVVEPVVPESCMVPVLMFHDVKANPGGTWSMSEENFRSRMQFLLDNGFTPITFNQLVDYAHWGSPLPEKPVCVTLDDGYYSNYKYVFPIVKELNIPITVFVNFSTVRAEGTPPDPNENTLPKLSFSELAEMESSPLVHIQSHTYALHGENTSYSEEVRLSALPLEGEGEAEYKEIFSRDCQLVEDALKKIGTWNNLVFSYPNGRHHQWSEEVLRERGYLVSLTTNYGHVNRVKRNVPSSLYLLGRMNVNDDTTDADLLKYLERE